MNHEESNPLMSFIVGSLGIVCLAALAIQTWFFINWLMGPTEDWMKYITLGFFDIAGGIWIVLRLFHTPPNKATWQVVGTGIVVDFLLSASTTIAWTFIFITRTPLSPDAIAGMVATARWVIAFAVIFNSFLAIYYSGSTWEHWSKVKHPNKKRWADENVYSTPTPRVQVQQEVFIPPQIEANKPAETVEPSTNKPGFIPPVSTNKSIPPLEASTNKKKRRLPS